MSRKVGVTQHLDITRIPTMSEMARMRQWDRSGGQLHPTDASVVMLDHVRDATQTGRALSHGLSHSAGRVALTRGIRLQAMNEDPLAFMTEAEVRDHVSGMNTSHQLGLTEEEVNRHTLQLVGEAQARARERHRMAVLRHYSPAKDGKARGQDDFVLDILWNRKRRNTEPTSWAGAIRGPQATFGGPTSDMKGGRTVRAATGGGRPGDFADAEQGAPPAETSASGRLRSTLSTGRAEQAAYRAIQKEFYEKHGRSMDEDTAWLRAGMKTGSLSRDAALRWGREIRQERDMALARRLAAEDIAGMPRDANGFIVPRGEDPFVRYETWDLRRAAVQSMLNATGRGADAEFTPAQKMFLSHKYGLAPQVSLHESYRQIPWVGHGPQGTFDKGGVKSFSLVPEGHVIDVDTGSIYSETDHRVAFSRSSISRARDKGVLNQLSPVTLMHNLAHPGFGSDSVKTQVFVSPEEYNLRIGGGSITWAERTGRYTPVEGEFADPNWQHFRDAGERYPGDFVPELAKARGRARPAQNPLAGIGPFGELPVVKHAGAMPRLRLPNPGAFIGHQLPGSARTRLKEEKIHGK